MNLYKIFGLTLLLVAVFSCGVVFAENTFTFSTEPQSMALGDLSGPITIHSDSPVSETTYILLTSTSGSGQFFSSKTSVEPIAPGAYVYISTNNSNRTIYYKDTLAGDFVITANIFNKEKTNQITSVSQHIFIGTGTSNTDTNSTTTTATTTDETNNAQVTTSDNQVVSAHSSPSPLSNTENKIEFEISAGRDRLALVGSPILFRVNPTKLQNVSDAGISYYWSFGDGTFVRGKDVHHAYKFAGDYSVVVNANYSDKQAVSRMLVRVINPNFSMVKVFGGIEVQNNSGAEANLEGWSLVSTKKAFVFPVDTLIPNGKKIIFADDITGMMEGSVSLFNPLGKEFAQTKLSNISSLVESKSEISMLSLKEIQEKIEEVKKEVALISPKVEENEDRKTFVVVQSDFVPELKLESVTNNSLQSENLSQVFEAEKKTGLVSRIFTWPISGFNFVKKLFVEE